MPRRLILPAALATLLLLSACVCNHEVAPRAEDPIRLTFTCRPCDPAELIGVLMENDSADTLQTSMCDWRLYGTTSDGDDVELYRLDCSAIYPVPIIIPPATSAVLDVELEPAVIADWPMYRALEVRVEFRYIRDGESRTMVLAAEGLRLKVVD